LFQTALCIYLHSRTDLYNSVYYYQSQQTIALSEDYNLSLLQKAFIASCISAAHLSVFKSTMTQVQWRQLPISVIKLLIAAVRLQLNEILASVTLEEVLRVNSDVSITPCQESIQDL